MDGRCVALVLACGLLAGACGGSDATASQRLVGTWTAENLGAGEARDLEFLADGTVRPEGEPEQDWEVVEGDPATLRILDAGSGATLVELELVFDGDDRCTLSGMGITATLTRK